MFFDVDTFRQNPTQVTTFPKKAFLDLTLESNTSQDNFDIHQRHAAQEDHGGYEVDTIFMTSDN